MEDPRIISALFIFLKMAYYNVLINTEIFSTDIVWEVAKKMDIIMPDMLYGEKRLQI